jgi:hypothetical protein
MAFQIRQTTIDDIPHISALYKSRKIEDELKWVFTNPYNTELLNSFVAIDDNGKIFGAIGYSTSTYKIGEKEFSGTVPMSWIIHPDHKGFAGIQLFKKAIEMSEVGITIGGSQAAKNIYPVFKLKYVGDINSYIKVLKPLKYFFSLNTDFIHKCGNLLLTIPSFLSFKKADTQDILLKPYSSSTESETNKTEVLQKQITDPYIQWLLNCPVVEAFAFHVYYKNQFMGNVVCYKSKENKNINGGRIVYLPYLGNDIKIWQSVIYSLEKFLKSQGCVSISGLGFHSETKKAFESLGYVDFIRKRKPFYVKDNKNLLEGINLLDWHLQYTEGDKAYRSI